MAERRAGLYLWATWLAKLMAGDTPCLWQTWFQARHKLPQRPAGPGLALWQAEHTRFLAETTQRLRATGVKVYKEIKVQVEWRSFELERAARVEGRLDCVADGGARLTVVDCKTGEPRPRDDLQVMLYMFLLQLNPMSRGKAIAGEIRYTGGITVPIDALPPSFVPQFEAAMRWLVADEPPMTSPGGCCARCPITEADCPDRWEAADEAIPVLYDSGGRS